MTKEEILRIIYQNKDILTPENYQGILKNVDIFTEEEKLKIVHYLAMANELMRVNQGYMKAQNALFKKSTEDFKQMDQKIIRDIKDHFKRQENQDKSGDSGKADDLLSNL